MTNNRRKLPPVHIHPILWAFIAISMITGTFIELAIIFAIVFIHELGHYTVANWYRWRIRRIYLWVFGGVMETDEHGSKPIKQELFIVLAGPLQHVWIYGLLLFCLQFSVLPSSVISIAMEYNAIILLFNLLPIWPLDGGKLVFLLYSSILPYRKAHSLTIICSATFTMIGLISLLVYFPFTFSTFLLLGFILWENRLEWKQRYFTFMRFLLKRHNDPLSLRKIRPIVVTPDVSLKKVFGQFKRNYRHHIYVKHNNYLAKAVDEKSCLDAYFNLKQYHATAGEISGFYD